MGLLQQGAGQQNRQQLPSDSERFPVNLKVLLAVRSVLALFRIGVMNYLERSRMLAAQPTATMQWVTIM